VSIIGAGKMSELTVKHLRSGGVDELFVLGRTYDRAAEIAAGFGGKPREWDKLSESLADSDIVISSTSAPGFVLTKELVQQAIAGRRTRPLLMLDIAVPRDIDPAVGDLPNVFLYDIDDLHSIVDNNITERQREAVKVEAMIASEMQAFEEWKRMVGVAPVIQALQSKANTIHEETMSNLLQKLPELDEREIRVIRKLTKSIANQLLRDPILRIKEMSVGRGGAESLDYFTQIFALENVLEEQSHPAADEAKPREAAPKGESVSEWPDKPGSLALQ
jgi:glutamyl-tRNA reductase